MEKKDIFVIDHVNQLGRGFLSDNSLNQLDMLRKLGKDLKRTQIRKGKIKRILCQNLQRLKL